MTFKNKRSFVMVQSEANLGKRIQIRTAPKAYGPWSAPVAIHTVTDVERDRSYFTYAAKGHARFSQPGELLVTYVVNATDFGIAFRDAEIYRPRFIRVPIESFWPR